ncbi:protein TIC 40, chloroplastic [Euphorbia lathyris]|uniref:protein TIC 40, chloroplastic n=1 Tax=Euphorbia lathyris TaxID=212925 RepID=UPI003313B782
MENLNMALLSSYSSSSPKLVVGYPTSLNNLTSPQLSRTRLLPFSVRNYRIVPRNSTLSISANSLSRSTNGPPRVFQNRRVGAERMASISSSSGQQTSSVGVNPLPVPSPSSQFGSPLFWVGVGVALSAVFSWVATYLKKYAMQQAFQTMMNQMNTQNTQFSNPAFPSGSPFPFPTPPASGSAGTSPFSPTSGPTTFPSYPTSSPSTTSPSAVAAKPPITVDVPAAEVEMSTVIDFKDKTETQKEPKKYAFVDVSPEETFPKSPFSNDEDISETSSPKNTQFVQEVSQNGAASTQGPSASEGSQSTQKAGLSVEALEKMMEDPTVQKMVYPYLPEEMRNPTTFKWMLQNPQYRQQLEDMLNNMGGSGEWDNRMMDSLKNFDLSSPEVKQQFDQIGLTPEEVISKIMANPDVAMAFQNPRVQQAIMDCSQNPLSIAKYQNDKEVMDVFNKISELFPGVTGSP